ncbi:MAG TPA: efflux RND transporter periplasmic adaptor subunit [Candidatus Sulfotelmatobacter sp.]|nr:efflux RND transporter periplasmic adaptor subunit [Candidatus Sulfotelmatobacter sp.]
MRRDTILLLAGLLAAITPPWGFHAEAADLDCLIEPRMVVSVAPAVEGLLESVLVDRGDVVRQGQVLATLESSVERATVASSKFRSEMEAALKSNQVRVEYGGRKAERTGQVYKEGGISIKDVDEAETEKLLAEIGVLEARENRRLAELELARATEALGLRTIRSPLNGVVVQRFLAPGEFAKQVPILKLAQIDPLYVEVIAPVALIGKIQVGRTAEVRPEAPMTGAYQARVIVVDQVVDAASGTFGIRLELPNPENRLPAGLKCKVRFPSLR